MKQKRMLLVVVVFVLILGLRYGLRDIITAKSRGKSEENEKVKCELVGVVDGDTLSVIYNGERSSVRLTGVDAPESVHIEESKNNDFGKMASDYTKNALANIDYVYLEFDISMRDTYDRLLSYVYMDADNEAFSESLNYMIVVDGYAVNKEYAPNTKYSDTLTEARLFADENKIGLWVHDDFRALWN